MCGCRCTTCQKLPIVHNARERIWEEKEECDLAGQLMCQWNAHANFSWRNIEVRAASTDGLGLSVIDVYLLILPSVVISNF